MNNHPNPNRLKSPAFVSYRRLWLDFCLEKFSCEMRGKVIDLGGKRENKRGNFHPPEADAENWWYLNLEMGTHPNIFGDVIHIPLRSAYADVVICTEVLEHINDPNGCVDEIYRLLHPGGTAFISVPFMYPIHADPYDFQRFTIEGLRYLFSKFSSVEIFPMGGYLGTLGMFVEIGVQGISGQQLQKKVLRRSFTWLGRMLCSLDLSQPKWTNSSWQNFTTGYFLKAIK